MNISRTLCNKLSQNNLFALFLITVSNLSLVYPARSEQACVKTSAGERVCGELISQDDSLISQKIEVDKFIFELRGCQRSGKMDVSCTFLITNIGDSDRILGLTGYNPPASRVITSEGEEVIAHYVQFGSRYHTQYADLTLIHGVPIRAIIGFENVPDTVRNLAIVEIGYFPLGSGRGNSIQFRNVWL